MHIIPSFLVDKASCTRQFESKLSLHSLASLFPIKEGIFSNPSVSLSKGSSTSNQAFLLRRKDVTALRCSEPLRSKVGGASKPSPCFAGWDRLNCSSLQYRSALVVARMRNIIFILLLRGLPQERYPSGLWRKSYDRHWHLMNDHNDRGYHL